MSASVGSHYSVLSSARNDDKSQKFIYTKRRDVFLRSFWNPFLAVCFFFVCLFRKGQKGAGIDFLCKKADVLWC